MPRDIDPSVRNVPGMTLYDMDDLQREVARNANVREAEASRARAIVDDEVGSFERWMAGLDLVPTIAALRARGEDIVSGVLAENEPRFESLSDADRARLRAMARSIVGRLLHEPTLRLKRSSGREPSYVYVQALRELFGLDPEGADGQLSARVDGDDSELGEAADVTPIDTRRAGPDAEPGRRRSRRRGAASDRHRS